MLATVGMLCGMLLATGLAVGLKRHAVFVPTAVIWLTGCVVTLHAQGNPAPIAAVRPALWLSCGLFASLVYSAAVRAAGAVLRSAWRHAASGRRGHRRSGSSAQP